MDHVSEKIDVTVCMPMRTTIVTHVLDILIVLLDLLAAVHHSERSTRIYSAQQRLVGIRAASPLIDKVCEKRVCGESV